MTNAIEVKNLCKNYPGFALQDVSFAVPEGTILGLVVNHSIARNVVLAALYFHGAAAARSIDIAKFVFQIGRAHV